MRARRSSGTGIALGLLSAATFGTSGAFATSLLAAGWTPAAAVTARLVIAVLALTVPALVSLRGRWGLLRRRAGTVAAYGVLAVAGAQLCYFNAVGHLSVGVALLLEYLGTILVVGWLWLRHGLRPRRLTVAGTAVAVLGLAMVLDVTGSERVDPVGVLWGLGAATGLAAFFVLSASGDDPLPPVAMAWAGMGVGAAALLLLGGTGVLAVHATRAPVLFAGHRTSWLVPVLGMSLVAAALAYVAGIGAARLLGPKVASFLGLTEVLFAVVVAWLLLGQLPDPVQILGGAVVLTGVALVRVDELRGPAGSERPASAPAAVGGPAAAEAV